METIVLAPDELLLYRTHCCQTNRNSRIGQTCKLNVLCEHLITIADKSKVLLTIIRPKS